MVVAFRVAEVEDGSLAHLETASCAKSTATFRPDLHLNSLCQRLQQTHLLRLKLRQLALRLAHLPKEPFDPDHDLIRHRAPSTKDPAPIRPAEELRKLDKTLGYGVELAGDGLGLRGVDLVLDRGGEDGVVEEASEGGAVDGLAWSDDGRSACERVGQRRRNWRWRTTNHRGGAR